MSNFFEVVFEDIAYKNVVPLLTLLIINSKNVTNAQCSDYISIMDNGKFNIDMLGSALDSKDGFIALINLQVLNVGDVILPDVLLRVLKYSNHYDIDFNFDVTDLESHNFMPLILKVQSYVNELATEYNVKDVFAGLEPACDKNTRYFTNQILGPYGNYFMDQSI